MTDFWYLVLMLALAYLILILPSGFFFSETEAEKPIKGRIIQVVRNEMILVVVVCVTLFPSFAFLRYSHIPISARTCVATDTGVFIASTDPVNLNSSACS